MREIFKRSLTGFFIVAVLISSILLGKVALICLVLLLTVFGLLEFYSLVERGGHHPLKLTGVFSGSLIALASSLYLHGFIDTIYLIGVIPLSFLILLVELFRRSENPIVNSGLTLLGMFYVVVPLALMNCLAYPPSSDAKNEIFQYSPNILLGFFFLLWTNDSFAYLVGSRMGKKKLYESVSPNKSWEGIFGGAIFCLCCAYINNRIFEELDLSKWLILGLLVIVFGTLGDLVQSLFKRSMQVKDTGAIFPGHGGILDRFDGVLFSIPFIVFYLQLLKLL